MKIDLKKYDPPGMETDKEQGILVGGTALTLIFSLIYFGDAFSRAYRRLWEHYSGSTKVLRDWPMEPFFELFGRSLGGYLIVILCMFAGVAMRYAYYRQGSKSIYLMRRLPDGKYLHRTCWVVPLIRIGMCVLVAVVSVLLCFVIYVTVTPAECLPWNYGGY